MKKSVKIVAKASNNKIFKADDGYWYISSKVLEGFDKDDTVEVDFDIQNAKRMVKTINKVVNVKNAISQENTLNTVKHSYTKSPDEIKRITKGNALNASAMALSGTESDPDILAEKILRLANRLVEWLEL